MDGARLQAKIYAGRGKAAAHIGMPCKVFRPQNETAPLTQAMCILPAAFNAADPKYSRANLYGKPVWYVDIDGRYTRSGDYLVRICDNAIWFIGAQQSLLPIVAIDCNASVWVQRQSASQACGTLPYNGLTVDTPSILGTKDSPWPASILLGGRSLAGIGIPGDVKDGGFRILLPSSIPEPIQAADLVTDDLGRRFAVESAERSDLGWRLTANEVHA